MAIEMAIEKELQPAGCQQCQQSDQFDAQTGKCRRCQPPSRALTILERLFRYTFLFLACAAALSILIRVGSYMISTLYKIFKFYMAS